MEITELSLCLKKDRKKSQSKLNEKKRRNNPTSKKVKIELENKTSRGT